MTGNTSDDIPDKKVIHAAETLMQMANSTRSRAMRILEIRATCFHREETLRYNEHDRAFSYTTADGQKYVVIVLKRRRGRPLKRINDHDILKRNRLAHFSIHSLVRDVAARLRGGVGSRGDVCDFVRDSLFIVDDTSDSQINTVVKGALDHLHNEDDPCVKYEKERCQWTYLHRYRQEEDFEDDSSSTLK